MSDRESPYAYSIILESERIEDSLDISSSVTDFDIFENLNKPYLTGSMIFVDNSAVVEGVDILGGETVTIIIKSKKNDDMKEIIKKFYITKIVKSTHVNDSTEVNVIHLTEDIGYISNLFNINKSFTGKRSSIIGKILKQHLSRSLTVNGTEINSTKVIVPNLNPIEAMIWLKNTTSTVDGYPFYLYSKLVGNDLEFSDLGTLLSETSINIEQPFVYSKLAKNDSLYENRIKSILNYQQGVSENLLELIQKSLIGSKQQYVDVLTNKTNSYDFDIVKDLLSKLRQKEVIDTNQKRLPFTEDFKVNETSFNKLQSRTITQIGGAGVFRDKDDTYLSYNEANTVGEYRLKTISRAMDQIIKKAPLQVIVEGDDFIDGDENYSIGKNIEIIFHKSDPDRVEDGDDTDLKKSGKHLIFATRHMFKREKYDLSLSCVKIARNDTT